MRGTVKQLNKGSKINAIILSKLPLFYFGTIINLLPKHKNATNTIICRIFVHEILTNLTFIIL